MLRKKYQHFLKILRWFKKYYPNRNNKKFARVVLNSVEFKKDILSFSGVLYTNNVASNATLILRKFRDEEVSFSSIISLSQDCLLRSFVFWLSRPFAKLRSYKFDVQLDVDWTKIPSSVYVLSVEFNGTAARLFYKADTSLTFHFSDGSNTIHLFEEPVISSLRIELYKLGAQDFEELSDRYNNINESNVKVCLISEYTNSARDNGVALYDYLKKSNLNIKPVYVIEKNNQDGMIIDGDNVVEFGSLAHLNACIDANVIAFTHHRTYGYPHVLRDLHKIKYDSVHTIFLQHGVTALKKMVANHYLKKNCNYSSVVVCSNKERDIFIDFMNFSLKDILVTGFPRYDRLYSLNQKVSSPEAILVFPTWRSGLEKKESLEVEESVYIQEWRRSLVKIREVFNGEVILIIHPILQRHSHLFSKYVDKISHASSFQDELLRSHCLITDYSSVCFDALYLKKPVIMFQFDRDEYGFKKDSFIDIDNELPGVLAITAGDVQREVLNLMANDWKSDSGLLRDQYFKWDDEGNCHRLVSVINNILYRKSDE